MKILNKLLTKKIKEDEYNNINNSKKKFYNLIDNNNISFFNPYMKLFNDYCNKYSILNNEFILHKLIKKNNRISSIGFNFKAIIKNNNNKFFYTNIFIKEIPLLSPNLLEIYNHKNLHSINFNSYKIYNNLYNLNSSHNIEIFISYLVSKLNELNYSPNFCKMYGYYNVILDKFTYDVSDDDEIIDYYKNSNYNYKLFNKNGETFLECRKVPTYLLLNEKANWDISFLNKLKIVDYNLILSIIFQLFSAIVIMQNIFGIKHNDLHFGNVMLKNTNITHYYFKYEKNFFKIPTYGFCIKIIDWGRATYNCNNYCGRNSVFNVESEAFGQYMFPKFNKLGKKSIDIIDFKWTDLVMISHSLLIEYNDFIKGDLKKLLMKNITDVNKNVLELKEYDWDLYLNITKRKFKINPNQLFKNKIFKHLRVDEKQCINKNIYNIYSSYSSS